MPSRNGERLLKFCQIWSHWTWGIIQWKYPWIVPLTACLFCYPEEKLSRYIFGKIKMGQNEISNRKLRSRIFERKTAIFFSFSREDLPLKMIIFVPISFQFWFGLAEKNIYFDARRLDCCQLCANMSAHFAFSTARKIAFGSWPCSI